jgi:hypothetical protein
MWKDRRASNFSFLIFKKLIMGPTSTPLLGEEQGKLMKCWVSSGDILGFIFLTFQPPMLLRTKREHQYNFYFSLKKVYFIMGLGC